MADDPKKLAELAKITLSLQEQSLKYEEELQKSLELASEQRQKELKDLNAIKEIEKERNKYVDERQKVLEAELKIQEDQLVFDERSLNTEEELLKITLRSIEADKELAELNKGSYFTEGQWLKDKEEQLKKIAKIEDRRKELEEQRKILDARKESVDAIEDIRENTHNLIKTLTGITANWKGTLWGKLALAGKEAGGFGAAISNMGKQIKEQTSVSNILGSSIMKVQETTTLLIKQQEGALAEFNKTTGVAGEYDSMLRDLGRDNLSLGINTQDAVASVAALRDTFSEFTNFTKETQKVLALEVATMEKFGVSVQDTAQLLQTLNKQMGLNVTESLTAQREIAATAIAIGEAPAKAISQFARVIPQLSAHGKDGVRVFRDLQTVAKATGLALEKLIGFTENFNTFEGAAQAVGSLNAVLGGPFLDSMELIMTTDPTERIKLMRGAVDNAGLSFENMEYYQRKAIASAMGLSDVSELAGILSGNIDELAQATTEDALSKEKMAEMAKKAQSVMEKLNNLMMSFSVSIGWVLDGVKWLLDGILTLNDKMGGWFVPLLVAATIVTRGFGLAIFKSIGTIIKFIAQIGFKTAAIGWNTVAKIFNTKATKDNTKATSSASSASMKFGLNLLLVGAGIALIGAGIYLATKGIASLAESFKGLSTREFFMIVGVLVGVAAGVALLAGVASVATLPLIALGASLLMVGGGILLMSAGIALVFNSISGFSSATAKALGDASLAIKEMMLALSDMPLLKTITFVAAMTALSVQAPEIEAMGRGAIGLKELIEVSVNLNPAVVKNTEELVTQAVRYKDAQIESSNAAASAPIIELLKESKTVNNNMTTGRSGPQNLTINLELDGRVLKKFVIDTLNNSANPRRI